MKSNIRPTVKIQALLQTIKINLLEKCLFPSHLFYTFFYKIRKQKK